MKQKEDADRVSELLGRTPRGRFEVVVRDLAGDPVVIRNAPLLDDGTPMPTRFWLVSPELRRQVDRLEASGGVRAAEAELDSASIADAHRRYALERDSAVPRGWSGPRPSGGVGGTARGVKCLHAHYAWHLAGGDDPVGRWVARRLRSGGALESGAVAAIDCGTNSTRLLVADGEGRTCERLMRITRLGRGVDRSGLIAPEALHRTIEVLEEFRRVMELHRVSRLRITATSAARDASNREEFFQAAAQVVGARPELLSGEEEAALSFAGATAELRSGAPWLVADIGGGSTELALGKAEVFRRPCAAVSLDLGCVRVTERFLHHDPPLPKECEAASEMVSEALRQATKREPLLCQGATLVGLAGTVAALASADLGLRTYDRSLVHHHRLSRQKVLGLLKAFCGEDAVARRRRPGMEAQRADVIIGGTLVLAAVMEHFDMEECLVSEADILDGLIASMLSPPNEAGQSEAS